MYCGGEIASRHGFDKDRFGFFDLKDEVEKLGYSSWTSLSYKMDNVFKVFHNDKYVLDMLTSLSNSSTFVYVYVGNGKESGDVSGTVAEVSGLSTELLREVNLSENAQEIDVDYEDKSLPEDSNYNPMGVSDTDDSI